MRGAAQINNLQPVVACHKRMGTHDLKVIDKKIGVGCVADELRAGRVADVDDRELPVTYNGVCADQL